MARRGAAFTLLFFSVTAISATGLAQQPGVADAITLYDLWVEEQLEYDQIPGVAVGVVAGQELVWAKGYGVADLESRAPLTPTTLFRLGSVSKLFTATAILQLRDAGELALDDPVTRHLPGFRIASPFAGAPPITIRHLLTHTAGLPREAAFPYWTTHEFPSKEQIWAALPGQTVLYPPGETYKYSNLGLALLGHVVEAVSGQSYGDYLRSHVFDPLGMRRSTAAPSPEQIGQLAGAYMRRLPDASRRAHTYYDTGGMKGAASVLSNVEELARFAALQLGDGPAEGSQILSGYTLREMQRPQFVSSSWGSGRGLGFSVSHSDGKITVSHGGWIGGHRSVLLLVPEEGIAAVAMTNAEDVSPNPFASKLLDIVGKAIAAATARPAPVKVADPAWQAYLGLYSDPWDWQYRVLVLGDELVMVEHSYPPEEDPGDGITRLTPVGPHTFAMPDGEHVVFELDDDGRVTRILRRTDYLLPEEN